MSAQSLCSLIFAGLANYRTLFSGDIGAGQFFQDAAIRSVYWTASVVGGQLALGLVTALVLNERFPGRAIFARPSWPPSRFRPSSWR